MDYNKFKECIMKQMKQIYPDDQYDVSIRRVIKNNGMSMDGLCIFRKGFHSSPTIYLEPYYEKYKGGGIITDILNTIQEEYRYGMANAADFKSSDSNYETVRNQIIMRLINFEKNAEILQECPYIRFHDLAITFRWLAYQDDIGISSALITYREMERWGIQRDQLYKDASINTPRLFPSRISKLRDVIEDSGMTICEGDLNLYVVTNEQGINGATCILYDYLLEEMALILNSSYYLLPSSIHEMMICPAEDQINHKMLLSLVKEANHMVVTMGEVLSDNIYYYDKDRKILSFLSQTEFNS